MKLLNIGCQYRKKKGYINLDINPLVKPDIIADACKMPFEDGEIDYIYSYHCIEHIPDFEGFMHETYRVLCNNGIMELHLPYGLGRLAWVHDHVKALIPHDFYRFEKGNKHKILYPGMSWKVLHVEYHHEYPCYLFPLWFVGSIIEYCVTKLGNYDRRFREVYDCHLGWLFPMATFSIWLSKDGGCVLYD